MFFENLNINIRSIFITLLILLQLVVNIFFPEYVLTALGFSFVILFYVSLKSDLMFYDYFQKGFNSVAFYFFFSIMLLAIVYRAIADYYEFNFNVYDTGSFAQGISYFTILGKYYNNTIGVEALCDHFTPSLLVFAPFFKIINTSWWLTGSKILFWALTAVYLRKLALVYELQKYQANMVALIWVLSAPYTRVLDFEFQPSNLACLVIVLSLYLWKKQKYVWYVLLMTWGVFLKENMPLVVICNGLILVFLEKNYKFGLLHIAVGVFLGFFIFFKLTPLLTNCENMHQGVLDPFKLVEKKVLLIFTVAASVAFFTFANWRLFIVFGAAFGLSLLSNAEAHVSTNFHYHDIPTTYAAVLCIFCIIKFRDGFYETNVDFTFFKPLIFTSVFVVFLYVNGDNVILHKVFHDRTNMKQRFELIDKVKLANKELDKTKQLIVQDCIGIYFLDFPYMAAYDFHNKHVALEKTGQYVVLNPDVNRYPFAGYYDTLQKELKIRTIKGEYIQHTKYLPLQVYQYTSKKFDFNKDTLFVEAESQEMSSDASKRIENINCSNGYGVADIGIEKTINIFGPYIPLPKGKYKIIPKFYSLSKTNNQKLGFLDVVSQEKIFFAEDISEGQIIEFELKEDTDNIEFRFVFNPNVNFLIDNLKVVKIAP